MASRLILGFYAAVSGLFCAYAAINWQVYASSPLRFALYVLVPAAAFLASLVLLAGPWRNVSNLFVMGSLSVLTGSYAYEGYVYLTQEYAFGDGRIFEVGLATQLGRSGEAVYVPVGPQSFPGGVVVEGAW